MTKSTSMGLLAICILPSQVGPTQAEEALPAAPGTIQLESKRLWSYHTSYAQTAHLTYKTQTRETLKHVPRQQATKRTMTHP